METTRLMRVIQEDAVLFYAWGVEIIGRTAQGHHQRVIGQLALRNQQLAFIINPCDGSVREVLKAPVTGMLFFMQDGPFITEHSPVFQVLAGA